ncbi:MFS transporter [Embleya sp. NPDC008237]|uniref:MFS transporter n=1 Tax=Embleya sp. NPDC008237 TaxID=3363978 RepID=UPI0036E04556
MPSTTASNGSSPSNTSEASSDAPAGSSPGSSGGPPGPAARGAGLVLAVVTGSMLLIGIDVTVVNLALPDMGAALDLSPTASSWVLNAYTLAFGGLLLLGGRLGDAFGRRRMFLAGVLLFTAASLLAGLAPWAWWLVGARVLQGVGGALVGPSTMALIVSTFEGPARARALSWYSAVLGGGASVGLILGGVLTQLASWRWVFLVNVPLGALLLALAGRVVREPERPAPAVRRRFDLAGALFGTAGITALVYAFIRAASDGWHDDRTIAGLAAAAVLLPAFGLVERRAAEPVLPLRLAATGTLARVLPIVAFYSAAMFSVLFMLARYFQEGRGFGPVESGLAFLPLMAAQFTTARVAPALARRVGTAWPVVVGALACTTGFVWLARLGDATGYPTGVLGPVILIGAGAGIAMTPLNIYGLSGVAAHESGAASGLLQTTQWMGGTLGLAVWVTVFGAATRGAPPTQSAEHVLTHGVATAFGAAAISAGLAAATALTLFRPARPAQPDETTRAALSTERTT